MKQRITSQQDIKKLGTIMGIWAHPDDETFSMAGIMAAAIKNGQKVVVVTATRGEAGVQDEDRWPAAQLGEIRSQELKQALNIIGVGDHYWLDYLDGACDQVNSQEAVERLISLIEEHKPDTLMTFGPDGMTGHDDHKTVSGWVDQAARRLPDRITVYHAIQTNEQYQSMLKADHELNVFFNIDKPMTCQDCDCDVCFCLPEDIFSIKLQALAAMPSQTEAMLKKYQHILQASLGMEAFVLAEGLN